MDVAALAIVAAAGAVVIAGAAYFALPREEDWFELSMAEMAALTMSDRPDSFPAPVPPWVEPETCGGPGSDAGPAVFYSEDDDVFDFSDFDEAAAAPMVTSHRSRHRLRLVSSK